jgi:hypothetical protein
MLSAAGLNAVQFPALNRYRYCGHRRCRKAEKASEPAAVGGITHRIAQIEIREPYYSIRIVKPYYSIRIVKEKHAAISPCIGKQRPTGIQGRRGKGSERQFSKGGGRTGSSGTTDDSASNSGERHSANVHLHVIPYVHFHYLLH